MSTQSVDDVLSSLALLIQQLGAYRKKVTDPIDRDALNSQILALAKWWQKIDDARAAAGAQDGTESAAQALGQITGDIKRTREDLQKVAQIIHATARAIALAEKVAKLLAKA